MSSRPDADEKRAIVREQQKPIAEWLTTVMNQKGWTATEWAREAGVGRDTVLRGVREDYAHVTSTSTLLKLAKAAGVPAPLHLGAGAPGIPPSHVFADILGELLRRLVPEREWPEAALLALGKALRHTLLEIVEEDGGPEMPEHARMAARMAARRLLDEDNTQHEPQT